MATESTGGGDSLRSEAEVEEAEAEAAHNTDERVLKLKPMLAKNRSHLVKLAIGEKSFRFELHWILDREGNLSFQKLWSNTNNLIDSDNAYNRFQCAGHSRRLEYQLSERHRLTIQSEEELVHAVDHYFETRDAFSTTDTNQTQNEDDLRKDSEDKEEDNALVFTVVYVSVASHTTLTIDNPVSVINNLRSLSEPWIYTPVNDATDSIGQVERKRQIVRELTVLGDTLFLKLSEEAIRIREIRAMLEEAMEEKYRERSTFWNVVGYFGPAEPPKCWIAVASLSIGAFFLFWRNFKCPEFLSGSTSGWGALSLVLPPRLVPVLLKKNQS